MIDHILIQIEKTDLVSMCKVLDDDALNVSTHEKGQVDTTGQHTGQL